MAKRSSFTFYGKLRKLKENSYTETSGEGWTSKRLQFQMICGNNVLYLKNDAFLWNDEAKRETRCYSDKKKENISVKWSDRLDDATIENIAPYALYVVDTDTDEHRAELETAGETEALAKSQAKRKKFVFDADFIDYVNKVINNEKSKDMIFKVTGDVTYSYSSEKGQYYREFNPKQIVRVAGDTEQSAVVNATIFYTAEDIDKSFVEETGDIILNTHIQYYDRFVKNDAFAPISFRLKADDPKIKRIVSKLESEPEKDVTVREFGLQYHCINGAPQIEFTEDMLTDEQKEDIEAGLCTFEDIKQSMGFVQGEKITENRVFNILRSYLATGAVSTGYIPEDLTALPASKEDKGESKPQPAPKKTESKAAKKMSEVANIFEDDEDEI